MANRMQKFIELGEHRPAKRAATARRGDFDEIYGEFDPSAAADQAARCSQCGIPYCQVHCPLHNNIPDWLMLTAEGRLEEAYELAQSTNTFPEICGRICPHDRLCEGNCVIERAGHGAVTIGAVERYITETAWERGWVRPIEPRHERQQSIGIVGAGPAGLAAAEQLRTLGYRVVVYDRHDRIGGLLVYGIPNFKLDKAVVARRAERLRQGGVEFHLSCTIGRDISLADLRARHAAVLLATGVYQARDIKVPGVGLGNVYQALDYLIASNRVGLGDRVPAFESGALNAAGKDVAVIGAGDTAMDCVRTAVRQGAASVKCLYRRDRINMPGSRREVDHAEEEGVEFVWLSAPEAFLGDEAVRAVRAQKVHLGAIDATGRQIPRMVEGSSFTVDAQMVIKALGFDPEDLPAALGAADLAVTDWGTLRIDRRSKRTSLNGVFAAGDIVRGASLVVWAIRDGRDAAAQIHAYIAAMEPAGAETSRRDVA